MGEVTLPAVTKDTAAIDRCALTVAACALAADLVTRPTPLIVTVEGERLVLIPGLSADAVRDRLLGAGRGLRDRLAGQGHG